MNCFIRYIYCVFILLFLLTMAGFSFADENKILCSGDAVNVTDTDIGIKKGLLPLNFRTTDDEIARVVLLNKLFTMAAKEKWADDKVFQKEIEIEIEDIIAKKYRQHILQNLDIPEGVLESYYLANPDKYSIPKQYKFSIVVFSNKITADQITKKIENSTVSFADAAKNESIDRNSGVLGGEIGWIPVSKIPTEWVKVIDKKKPGFISKPFVFDHVWYVIKIDDIKPTEKATFKQVRKSIRHKLVKDEYNKAVNTEFKELRLKYNIKCLFKVR